MNEKEKSGSFEVMKFGIMVVIALVPAAITYGMLQSRVGELEKDAAKFEVKIEANESHNQKQDLLTATWRTNTENRMKNIEKLTQDIHRAVVGE